MTKYATTGDLYAVLWEEPIGTYITGQAVMIRKTEADKWWRISDGATWSNAKLAGALMNEADSIWWMS